MKPFFSRVQRCNSWCFCHSFFPPVVFRCLRLKPRSAEELLYDTPQGKQPYRDFWYDNTWVRRLRDAWSVEFGPPSSNGSPGVARGLQLGIDIGHGQI